MKWLQILTFELTNPKGKIIFWKGCRKQLGDGGSNNLSVVGSVRCMSYYNLLHTWIKKILSMWCVLLFLCRHRKLILIPPNLQLAMTKTKIPLLTPALSFFLSSFPFFIPFVFHPLFSPCLMKFSLVHNIFFHVCQHNRIMIPLCNLYNGIVIPFLFGNPMESQCLLVVIFVML